MTVAHAGQGCHSHQLDQQLVVVQRVDAARQLRDCGIKSRRHEIVEEIRMVVAQVLCGELHVVGPR